MKHIILSLLIILTCLTPTLSNAQRQQSWHSWIQQVKQEAITQGIDSQLLDRVFDGMTPSKKHLQLDRSQPEKRITYLKYRNTRGDAFRIKLGKIEYRKHKQLIDTIGHSFGVDPCFIVAIWGLESSYGRFRGHFPVIQSLATLAYSSRRAAFFRKELFLALHILNEGHIELHNFKGEWAGATGQAQFLPSSWFKYAVDYNRDGRKDIWETPGDIFASIANYLAKNGWQAGQPCSIVVSLPHNFDQSLLTLKVTKTVREWEQLGVQLHGTINPNLPASIIHPYGGPDMMVFNNFKVLMRWNYSSYYAGTIEYMANKISQG
ncbi:MAG: lytic murein transglycosylase [Gammaproteobacteria bacterium]|jgi:membrane-bound lytic murein transglycosylase B